MDLVPVIEHTKDVLANYVVCQHVSKVQQLRTCTLETPNARKDKVQVEAQDLGISGNFGQRISMPESPRPLSNTSSTVPSIHTTDNADSIKKASHKISPPEMPKPGSITSDNTPTASLNTAPPDFSGESYYTNGPSNFKVWYCPACSEGPLGSWQNVCPFCDQSPRSRLPDTKPTTIAAGSPQTSKNKGDTEEPRKSNTSNQGVPRGSEQKIQESNHQIDKQTHPKQRQKDRQHTPPIDSLENSNKTVDITSQGLVTDTQVPSTTCMDSDPGDLLINMCDLCSLPYDQCIHSLTTTSGASNFEYDTFPEHPFPRGPHSLEDPLLSIFSLRQQTTMEPPTVQAHVEDTYTLRDGLLVSHELDVYSPGDRALGTNSRTTPTSQRIQAPLPGGFPCTAEGCKRIFERICDLKYVFSYLLSLPQIQNIRN
ncbi:hypothetical protein BU24DRAFT_99075 [Aaosphaeria arxii CBS 175.79]|uniref:Uncharacterized protein n=1 Tax=Aaosphaeria arxii CBS 175.79 TaxID=1450172 RepID=A0A6A5Y0S7_9PLEO|nr:uncharacterized protein BU24DRAFT_99075 [Aaosphaeria arxii CBS 175.79]KAF2018531.1 hypothetical protein BU24DRAFT_99075 [Aaosphaeria arxii CBS 175.79]